MIVVAFAPTRRVTPEAEQPQETQPEVHTANPDLDDIEQRLDALVVGVKPKNDTALPTSE